MSNALQPLFVLVFFVLIRAGDIAIGAAMTRDTIRAVAYGFTALLALLVLILSFGAFH